MTLAIKVNAKLTPLVYEMFNFENNRHITRMKVSEEDG